MRAWTDEQEAECMSVTNTGQPIPTDVAEHIFVPFLTTKPEGSGIGLSLSRQIMRASGGTLTMQQDEEAGTVYYADPELQLDVGSIGKGYAVEQVARAAEARGLTSALISVGGNLRAIGHKPDGRAWTGGVENPWGGQDILAALELPEGASLVTSGDYQRYFELDGVRYHHLIDPETRYPAAYFDSVTVLCSDSGLADGLSTGLFCMSLADGQSLVERLDGVEALWASPDGSVVTSSGWSAHTMK